MSPRIPWSAADLVLQGLAGLGLAAGWAFLALDWARLPESVPIHFDASGTPDAWGDKRVTLVLPGVASILYCGLSLLERFPHHYNYPWKITAENAVRQHANFRQMILVLKLVILWVLAIGVWETCQTALGRRDGLGWWFLPLALASTFGTIVLFVARGARER